MLGHVKPKVDHIKSQYRPVIKYASILRQKVVNLTYVNDYIFCRKLVMFLLNFLLKYCKNWRCVL